MDDNPLSSYSNKMMCTKVLRWYIAVVARVSSRSEILFLFGKTMKINAKQSSGTSKTFPQPYLTPN